MNSKTISRPLHVNKPPRHNPTGRMRFVESAVNGIVIPVPPQQQGMLHRFGKSGNGNGTVYSEKVYDAVIQGDEVKVSVGDIPPAPDADADKLQVSGQPDASEAQAIERENVFAAIQRQQAAAPQAPVL